MIDDLEPAFARIKEGGGEALIAARSTLTFILGKQTADLALAARLPSCYPFREAVMRPGTTRPNSVAHIETLRRAGLPAR